MAVFFKYLLSMAPYSHPNPNPNPESMVRTFESEFVANLPLSLPVKEFWKSINIWVSYGKSLVSCFFDSQCSSTIATTISVGWAIQGLSLDVGLFSGGQTGEWALVQEEQMGPLLTPGKISLNR